LYVLIFILQLLGLKPRAFGSVRDEFGTPLSFALVRVFAADLKQEIVKKVTDRIGRYYCLVPPGDYYVTVEIKNYDESYTPIYTSEVIRAKSGIINRKFKV